ncbi:MAG: hypothetical protein AVDCRST_MAG18-4667 [uncultured Thermomicrobiales bacterium]|uniref:Uncharacterized protein n=1 Tax=uncultured Thermomicrobiales bacterium TaxID=1645740 RepID=A0A6J4VVS6_9BACT|nr:MAG: hypothetical protein AVDCRST_MAG18-4667 [uncultured Thermomicrobiales bacterium]
MQERLNEAALVARVRRRVEAQEGLSLPEGRAPVGRRADGTQRQHVFDLVAENRSLIGEIRTYTLGESGGRPAGKFAHCYAACLFLFRSKARRKVLILTDRPFWSRFRRESEGLVEGIEIIHVPIDGTAPIVTDEPTMPEPLAAPPRPGAAPGRAPVDGPRGFTRQDELPVARRNKGGPGPRGRRPITGPRRGR